MVTDVVTSFLDWVAMPMVCDQKPGGVLIPARKEYLKSFSYCDNIIYLWSCSENYVGSPLSQNYSLKGDGSTIYSAVSHYTNLSMIFH